MPRLTRNDCLRRDANDPLREVRRLFALSDEKIYLDGNSLGPAPKATAARMTDVVEREWGVGLISSWLDADWVSAPRRIGDKIARLIGAEPGEVVAADSTSVNIFKALGAACSLRPGRTVILTEADNFPTDVYMIEGFAHATGGARKLKAQAPDAILSSLDDDVAVLLLTQVHYKTGKIWDMARVTQAAHDAGALVIWDLSHSTGSIDVALNEAGADFAVGCGYKFLNGGPGAPGYIFVASRHQARAAPVLSGWFGHAAPFAFEPGYEPAADISRFLCGTPPVLGLAALETGVDVFRDIDMQAVREKSQALGDVFITLMEQYCSEYGFALASPSNADERGGHVSYAHPQGYEIMQALRARGVIGDFRAPDILRFGMTPLYTRFTDIHDAVGKIAGIMKTEDWRKPEYAVRVAVT